MRNTAWADAIPDGVDGIRLCKTNLDGSGLKLSETCYFSGKPEIVQVLNQAAVSGKVGDTEIADATHWADILRDDDMLVSIRLDRGSWNALKNVRLRCRMMSSE